MTPVAKRIGAVIGKKRIGAAITFRRSASTGGVSSANNPVIKDGYSMTVATAASIGATAITLNAPAIGNWFIEAEDILTIGANVVTVATRTLSASGKFTNVPLSSALTEAVTVGQAVSVKWVNDYPCKAIVAGYEARLIDGTTVKVGDVRVSMQTTDTDGRSIPKPTSMDRIIIDGSAKSIVTANAEYVGPDPAFYDVQARG